MKNPDNEGIYIGSSKFDKLRRVSVIKPVAEKLQLKEGDEVSFYQVGTAIEIRKRVTDDKNQDQMIDDYIEKLREVLIVKRDGNKVEIKIPDNVEQPFDWDELDNEHKNKFITKLSRIADGLEDYEEI